MTSLTSQEDLNVSHPKASDRKSEGELTRRDSGIEEEPHSPNEIEKKGGKMRHPSTDSAIEADNDISSNGQVEVESH
jgi:hypothetical protein